MMAVVTLEPPLVEVLMKIECLQTDDRERRVALPVMNGHESGVNQTVIAAGLGAVNGDRHIVRAG